MLYYNINRDFCQRQNHTNQDFYQLVFLHNQPKAICKLLFVAVYPAVVACEIHMSYRTDVINHLTADRASLLCSKVAVVTLL